MKKMLILLGVIVGIVGVVGIGMFRKAEPVQEENSLERILNKGTFILGLDDSFPPMGFRNENNEIVGFDIDVAKEVCDRLGIELVLQPISWTAKEQELNSYNIDCIWNGMSVDADRKEKMCLSMPYLGNSMSFVVKNENSIELLEELKGKKIGVQSGSTAEKILQDSYIYNELAEVISYSDNITAFMDLEINQIDCVFLDNVVANFYITTNNKPYKVLKDGLQEEEYAIGFRKQDVELCEKVNEILLDMKEDGTLAQISTVWFGKDITIIEKDK